MDKYFFIIILLIISSTLFILYVRISTKISDQPKEDTEVLTGDDSTDYDSALKTKSNTNSNHSTNFNSNTASNLNAADFTFLD